MKQYDIKCPYCGTMNKVYLDETNGWMECDNCLHTVNAYHMLTDKALLALCSNAIVKKGVQQL